MKKIWFPNTRTKKRCSGAFKDVPRYLDYVGVSRWIGCRNFCGNTGKCLKWTPYVSISSLVDTDQLSERHKKRAPFSTTETCYSVFYPCYDIFIRQKMSQYERTLFHSRRQPHDQTAADALTELACDSHTLKCLRTLMSFSPFSAFPIIQLEMSDAACCQEVINGARGTRYTCPFCTSTFTPLPAIVHLPGSTS